MPKQEQNDNQKGPLHKLLKALTFQEEQQQEQFLLKGIDDSQPERDLGYTPAPGLTKAGFKKPLHVRRVQKKSPQGDGKDASSGELLVSPVLKDNKAIVEELFSLPKNKDPIVREFVISLDPSRKAFALFIEGISDKDTINEAVLKPLMILSKLDEKVGLPDLAEYIKDRILYGHDVAVLEKYQDILEKVNYGATAVFIDGVPRSLVVETKGWDKRSIGKPEVEQVIRGPHEGFNETLRSNTGLIRKALRNHKLITEMIKIGDRNKTDVAVLYLEDLANPSLVEEVKRRISSIKSDYVGDIGVLEQFIEDHPFLTIPQALATERPDRVVAGLIEGKVAIMMDNSPFALIVPTTFFSLLHTPEDYNLRIPYSNLVRILRVAAIFITIVTPSLYVAISNYHQEMIPTELMLAVAASRQTVPFPTIIEVFMMEFAFELIREAGVRIPGVIGNTLGIVGALILGQAAVQAGIVSPILIIVVAITGLASFAIPSYSMSFAFRGVRFIFTVLGAFFGFFGITAGLFILLNSVTGMKSFGVPMMAPIGPRTKAVPDLVIRGPIWSMEEREDYIDAQDRRRQPQVSRGWIKRNSGGKGGGK